MLFDLLTSGENFKNVLANVLLTIPVIILALSVHELSHGFVAHLCGDDTAKNHGRLTLNPVKHLDPIGTLCMFLIGFGWAKPVPVIMRNFKKPRRDMFFVAFAGPLSNILSALIYAPLYILSYKWWWELAVEGSKMARPIEMLSTMMLYGIILNIGLAIFNLIPVPPLDGSNMLLTSLPPQLAARYSRIGQYSRYIILGALVLSYIGVDVFYPLSWLTTKIAVEFLKVFSFLW